MKKRTVMAFVILWGMIGFPRSGTAEDGTPPSLAEFDGEVAICRRVVREYCAIVQDMTKGRVLDTAKQERGLALLKEARTKWDAVQKKYAAHPPAEYALDNAFKARLKDFANALEDMEKALAAGDARRSFQACGFGCGLFVAMHEQNGLDYAIDKLFHLRKDIKTAQTLIKTKGLRAVQACLPAMLQKRDAVLLAPPPFPTADPRDASYQSAVAELSAALDRLAIATARGDHTEVESILQQGLQLVNKPYGLAL